MRTWDSGSLTNSSCRLSYLCQSWSSGRNKKLFYTLTCPRIDGVVSRSLREA